MLSRPEIISQLNRLSACAGWNNLQPAAMQEIADCFRELADDDGHLARMVTKWLRTPEVGKWVPRPADIELLADETRQTEEAATVRGNRNCPSCKGTGFREVWTLTTVTRGAGESSSRSCDVITPEVAKELSAQVDGRSQRVDRGVAACGCDYGRMLWLARQQRQLSEESEKHEKQTKRRNAA